MSQRPSRTWKIAPLAALALAACRGDADGRSARALAAQTAERTVALAPAEVVVRSRDFAFQAPDTVAAGPTTLRLINDGPDFHHVWLVRLDDGHTMKDLMQALMKGGHAMPSWAVNVGGPNAGGAPGDEVNATIDLAPGDYVLLCVIPGPDGVPHIMKGMARAMTAIAPARSAAMPAADVVMTLDDFSFELDRPLAAGRQVVRIVNRAAQPHEVLFVRLEPGRTAADFVRFVGDREGAMPGNMVGGTTGMDQGIENVIALDLEPGRYALLCFIPDAGDGRPHFLHGMMREIEVL